MKLVLGRWKNLWSKSFSIGSALKKPKSTKCIFCRTTRFSQFVAGAAASTSVARSS